MTSGGASGSLQWVRQVHARLAQHLQHQTTDLMAPAVVPSSLAGNLYFSKERDDVARAAPAFVLPSCLLPPAHVVAEYLPSTQTPIFLHREATSGGGLVRAYVNQCRHRGAALISPKTATVSQPRRWKGAALTCPYHAWTYDVRNGHLKKVPGEQDGFPSLDKTKLGLQPMECTEIAGGIWVGGEQMSWSFDEIDQELKDLWLDPLVVADNDDNNNNNNNHKSSTTVPTSRLVGFREWTLQANWQLIVETFLESYHVQFLHQNTLGLVTHGNRMVVDRLDHRSLRHTVPLSNFQPIPDSSSSSLPLQAASAQDPFFAQTTTTYFLFPNVAISLFKRFAMFLSILPAEPATSGGGSSSSSSVSRVRAWGVTHATALGEELGKQQRDFESVLKGIEEDWECTETIQRGLKPETRVQHGRFEGNNVDFLRHVGELSEQIKRQQ